MFISTYTYNHHNQRTKLVEGSDTTLYPFSSYHIENGTPKLYLALEVGACLYANYVRLFSAAV